MTDASDQRRFWKELTELRFGAFYLHEYHLHFDKWRTRQSALLALVASGSVATWAIWKEMPLFWASLVALSHVISAIRQWLPWERRLRSVVQAKQDLDSLALLAESRWFGIRSGHLSREEVDRSVMEIKRQIAKVNNTHFHDAPLPVNEEYRKKGAYLTKEYFAVYSGA